MYPSPASPDDRGSLLREAIPAGDGTDRIKWVLPDAPNPILTRELVYTGITRARHLLTQVETGRGQLMEASQRRVMRVSGLGS
ncbi:MAG: hypothetical protein CME72_10940 [Halomonadaceae bacterium]|nr:hypothetical protein [Halomonadaceae bacterium]